MKTDITNHKGKSPSLEEGPMKYERINEVWHNRVERDSKCNRCIEITKVILCVQLALILVLLGRILLTNRDWRNTSISPDELYGGELAHDLRSVDTNLDIDPTTLNHLGDSDATIDQIANFENDDSNLQQYWQDYSRIFDHMNRMKDLENNFLQDDRLINVRLNVKSPDFLERFRSQRVRSVATSNEDSSSSLSEKTTNSALKIHPETESSSGLSDSSDPSTNEHSQDFNRNKRDVDRGCAAGMTLGAGMGGGAAIGAGSGAAIGSVVPGIGTAIGALIGAIYGVVAGGAAGGVASQSVCND